MHLQVAIRDGGHGNLLQEVFGNRSSSTLIPQTGTGLGLRGIYRREQKLVAA
ncbi:hypothetical protein [Undibacterium sp. RuRC25W]|uniref:hypothetical protein n=1 Tax=Undibacterium sp. RuRC25W TaxID=3413047 RepID=UPI003BF22ADD